MRIMTGGTATIEISKPIDAGGHETSFAATDPAFKLQISKDKIKWKDAEESGSGMSRIPSEYRYVRVVPRKT